jgi:hypothetical protein
MVYATNVAPHGSWYTVRIKAIFLRSNDDDDANNSNQGQRQHVRLQANEDALNGNPDDGKGVIIDSGTTDTYLPLALQQPFQDAWEQAVGGGKIGQKGSVKYDNNPRYMKSEEMNSLPTILIVLRGHEPSNINIKRSDAVGLASSHAEIAQLPPTDSNSSSTLPLISETDVFVAIPPNHYMEESSLHPGRYAARLYFTERIGSQPILGSNFMMGHDVHFDNQGKRIGFAESDCDNSKFGQKRMHRLR